METQTPETPTRTQEAPQKQLPAGEFKPGSTVVYALHGKCTVLAVETRTIDGEAIRFYKLEVLKSALSRSTRQEPAIWLPVTSAKDRGLRNPIQREQAEAALSILTSREYFFQPSESWSTVHPKIEALIRSEGGTGLAKAYSFLYVVRNRHIVPPAEVVRLHETVARLLFRELSDALGDSPKVIEERIAKGLRQKLAPDN